MKSLLLDLPEELRFKVYESLILALASPPATAADLTCGNRVTDGLSSYRVYYESRPAVCQAMSLLQTNWQIHREVTRARQLLFIRELDYHLDLILLQDGSIWPTWTGLPCAKNRVSQLTATFRLFHVPESIDGLPPRSRSLFVGGDGSPPSYLWVLYDILKRVLHQGPLIAKDESVKGDGLIVEKLVIDVALPTEPNSYPLFGPSATDRFSSMHISMLHRRLGIDDAKMSDAGKAATQLAELVWREIYGLLGLGYHRFDYGQFLYDKVGEIAILVAGKPYKSLDLGSILSTLPLDNFFGTFYRVSRRRTMADWIRAAEERRKQLRLPIQRRTAQQQQFLDDVDADDSRDLIHF